MAAASPARARSSNNAASKRTRTRALDGENARQRRDPHQRRALRLGQRERGRARPPAAAGRPRRSVPARRGQEARRHARRRDLRRLGAHRAAPSGTIPASPRRCSSANTICGRAARTIRIAVVGVAARVRWRPATPPPPWRCASSRARSRPARARAAAHRSMARTARAARPAPGSDEVEHRNRGVGRVPRDRPAVPRTGRRWRRSPCAMRGRRAWGGGRARRRRRPGPGCGWRRVHSRAVDPRAGEIRGEQQRRAGRQPAVALLEAGRTERGVVRSRPARARRRPRAATAPRRPAANGDDGGEAAPERVAHRQPPARAVARPGPRGQRRRAVDRPQPQAERSRAARRSGTSMKWCCHVVSTETPMSANHPCSSGAPGARHVRVEARPEDHQQRDVQRGRLVERLVEAAQHVEQRRRRAPPVSGPLEREAQREGEEARDRDRPAR